MDYFVKNGLEQIDPYIMWSLIFLFVCFKDPFEKGKNL